MSLSSTCPICLLNFTNYRLMNTHQQSCNKEMTLILPNQSLILKRDDNGYFTCECNQGRLCTRKFKNPERLQAHIDKSPKLIWVGSSVCIDCFWTIQAEF